MNPLSRLFIDASEAARDSPRIYSLWLRVRDSAARARLPNPRCDLHVAGYPRSGNTYAARLLEEATPRLQVATHVHGLASIRLSLRQGVPTVVVVRQPVEALASYMVRRQAEPGDAVQLERLMRRYVRYYGFVAAARRDLAVLPFDELCSDAWSLFRAADSVMPGPLPLSPQDARQAAERVLERMRARQRQDPPELSSLPHAGKDELKAAHRHRIEEHPLRARAEALFRELAGNP